MRRIDRALTAALFALTACATEPIGELDQATSSQPSVWYSLDGSAAYTPVDVQFVASASTNQASVFDVTVHGFWLSPASGNQSPPYGSLYAGPLRRDMENGEVAFPHVALQLATLPGTTTVTVTRADTQPATTYVMKPYESGTVPTHGFHSAGSPDAVRAKLGSVTGFGVQLNPFEYDLNTTTVTVHHHARFTVSHAATNSVQSPITRDRSTAAQALLANWSVMSSRWPTNNARYTGNILMIYEDSLAASVTPLILRKKRLGWFVTAMPTSQAGSGCPALRSTVQSWYSGNAAYYDNYLLLIGDETLVPRCHLDLGNPASASTDDWYGTVDGNNVDKELHVGRLPVATSAELDTLRAKIFAYQDTTDPTRHFEKTALVAHVSGESYVDESGGIVGNYMYQWAAERVATVPYVTQPSFLKLYGAMGALNSDLIGALNAGLGLVAYRGHGEPGGWSDWDFNFSPFWQSDAAALTNTWGHVVWSIGCNTAGTSSAYYLQKKWLEQSHGAVAFYGASVDTGAGFNNPFLQSLFTTVFDKGVNVHGQALDVAEASVRPWNAMDDDYVRDMRLVHGLLGDPSMRLRRGTPRTLLASVSPAAVTVGSSATLTVTVTDAATGLALPNVVVAAYKAGTSSDEVFGNLYSDSLGRVVLPVHPTTTGAITISLRDEQGDERVAAASVPVQPIFP